VKALQRALHWLLALFGVTTGCAIAVWVTLWISVRSSAAVVPDLQGLDPSQAAKTVARAGLVPRLQDGVFDQSTDIGRIALQRPPAGFQLKRGATVLIYPSLGRATIKMPDLVGLPDTVAESELEDAKLHLGAVCQVDGQSDALGVVAQQPAAGALVGEGVSVSLLVNRGAARRSYVMPDFVGERESAAAETLRRLGFRLAAVKRVDYQGLAPGLVLRQDPPAGGPVLDSAVVALWVSQ
jgi:beta-lactam-binding protein with PASTA domain